MTARRRAAPAAKPSEERGKAGWAPTRWAAGSAVRTASPPRATAQASGGSTAGMRLYTPDGIRKYVTAGEREAFLAAAEEADRQVRTLCMTLAYAGCRLSEALALTADWADLAAGVLIFESLKKRQLGILRAVRCRFRPNSGERLKG